MPYSQKPLSKLVLKPSKFHKNVRNFATETTLALPSKWKNRGRNRSTPAPHLIRGAFWTINGCSARPQNEKTGPKGREAPWPPE
ncbi:unnamed protein product [Bursaphelenchus xylophilus]|uniref:(pine wood nematode) hypothetical protein n=1 Tax=Bursaphelenchus xylophilus TaxID=6326 RepID=A0A7I8XPP1_BURXY|nr:unnamed protein product [Bursaphelenchus xylophilus]CAG9087830.1 unnamed protein product [Bursaphelenchus xylophilus]